MPAISVRTSAPPGSTLDGKENSRSRSGAANRSSTEALAPGIPAGTLSNRSATFNAELETVVGCFGPIWRGECPREPKNQDFRFHRGSSAVSPHQSSPVNLVARTRNCQPGTSVHAPYSAGSSGFGSGSQNDVIKPIA